MNKLFINHNDSNNCESNSINNIPNGWDICRLKELGNLYSGLSGKAGEDFTDESEFSVPYIPFTNVANNFYLSVSNLKSVIVYPDEKQNYVKKNDLFFLMSSEGYEDIGKSSLLTENLKQRTYLNSFCKGFRFNKLKANPRYINYFLHSDSCRNRLIIEGKGFTRINLKMEKINDLRLLMPPLNQQNYIAQYLDEKTAALDCKINLFTKKVKQYEMLKRALINETVTRGLDKTISMKDSGIQWIGQVPEHWEVKRAKDLFERKVRPSKESDDIVTAFRDGQVTLRLNRRVDGFTNAIKEHGYQQIIEGDLVIHAMDAFAGAIGVSESTGKSSPVYSAYVAIDKTKVHIPYYGKLIREMALSGFISSLGKGIRERSTEFRHREFSPLKLVLPPFKEQKAISEFLDEKTAKIDQIVMTINMQIGKLKELRKTLINNVVTGKIKVTDEGLIA